MKKEKIGRPEVPDHEKKKPHSLSFTDSQWRELETQAGGKSKCSAYIIKKLKLDK